MLPSKLGRKLGKPRPTPEDGCVYEFMREDRVAEVHGSGSRRSVKTKDVNVGNFYSDDESGTLMVSGPPGTDGAIIKKPQYYFTIAGTERIATELCADYAELLARMVSQYKADDQMGSRRKSRDEDERDFAFPLRGRAM
jgi:hypothetical protein